MIPSRVGARIASLNGLYVSRVNEVACNRCRVNKITTESRGEMVARNAVVWGVLVLVWCGVWLLNWLLGGWLD